MFATCRRGGEAGAVHGQVGGVQRCRAAVHKHALAAIARAVSLDHARIHRDGFEERCIIRRPRDCAGHDGLADPEDVCALATRLRKRGAEKDRAAEVYDQRARGEIAEPLGAHAHLIQILDRRKCLDRASEIGIERPAPLGAAFAVWLATANLDPTGWLLPSRVKMIYSKVSHG